MILILVALGFCPLALAAALWWFGRKLGRFTAMCESLTTAMLLDVASREWATPDVKREAARVLAAKGVSLDEPPMKFTVRAINLQEIDPNPFIPSCTR